ncbi:MAG TPA: GNAT family N-acetyltransferase [Thermoanaerobacterales bacterium]|nr:GNAT family N-acetyltransferase [Thermoanaerobacterales bacterium]
MTKYKVRQTEDYRTLEKLYIKHGIEVGNEPVRTENIKNWKVIVEQNGKEIVIGGITLGRRDIHYVVNGISIEPEYRKMKIGTDILDRLVKYVEEIGVRELWLIAKAPGFFGKYGFEEKKMEESPQIFGCFNCDLYQKTCHPKAMVFRFY